MVIIQHEQGELSDHPACSAFDRQRD